MFHGGETLPLRRHHAYRVWDFSGDSGAAVTAPTKAEHNPRLIKTALVTAAAAAVTLPALSATLVGPEPFAAFLPPLHTAEPHACENARDALRYAGVALSGRDAQEIVDIGAGDKRLVR